MEKGLGFTQRAQSPLIEPGKLEISAFEGWVELGSSGSTLSPESPISLH